MGPQPGWRLLLQLLVYTSSCSGAIQYYSYYDGFKLQQQQVTETVHELSMCDCFSRCKATVTCRAATFTASSADSTGQSCSLASGQWVMKPSLESAAPEAQSASLIVGYQVVPIIDDVVSFDDAKKKCQSISMRLASLSDTESFLAVRYLLKAFSFSGTFWVDLRNMNGVWKWGDGVTLPANGQKPWADNEPKASNTHGAVEISNDLSIKTDRPGAKHRFICAL